VGFDDDSIEAQEKKLTTYNFNVHGIIQRMHSFILTYKDHNSQWRETVMEVEGMMIERGTAARPMLRSQPQGHFPSNQCAPQVNAAMN
jgi:hypothetical protein